MLFVMKCRLCSKEIIKYDIRFNHLVIDDEHTADVCSMCIDKFVDWHSKVIALLFPTQAMKKRYGEKKD